MLKLLRHILLAWLLAVLILPVKASETDIRVYIRESGSRKASASMAEPHRWLIRCRLSGTSTMQGCTVIQTLSPYLTYEPDSLQVRLLDPDGSSRILVMGEDFSFTGGSVCVESDIADRILIEFEVGSEVLQRETAEVCLSYLASFRKDVPMGTQILGTAQLTCTNENGNRTVAVSERAAVSTGGFHISLTNVSGIPIPGGKFMVAREVTEEESSGNDRVTELLDTGEEVLSVVYEPFLDARGNPRYTAETDAQGNAAFYGLAYGVYYLVQTEVPEGRGFPSPPVRVTVDEVSHLTAEDGWKDAQGISADNRIRIVNRQLVMPETGGPGPRLYTLSGTAVILSACMLLWDNRKKRRIL